MIFGVPISEFVWLAAAIIVGGILGLRVLYVILRNR